jgi:large subunit ribosomal protein L19
MDIGTLLDLKRNPNIPKLSSGDTVKVHVKVIEGEKERIQVFQGVVIRIKAGTTGNFTVRRVAYGTGAERSFPVNSPMIDRVEVIRHGQVRRARLFYLRGLTAKKARLKEKRILIKPEAGTEVVEEAPVAVVPEVALPVAEAPKAEAPKPETETK